MQIDGNPPALHFGQFTLDLSRKRLTRDGADVPLRAKSFLVLAALADRAGHIVPRDDLLSRVWPDVTVTDESLTQCVRDIRRALGDAGRHLRTVPRRGYLFEPGGIGPHATSMTDAPAGTARPRVAILPFGRARRAQQQAALDAITHDVIGQLSRLHGFHVIARASSFALRGRWVDPGRCRRLLGADYAVTGRAHLGDGELALDITILDCRGGNVVAAERVTAETGQPFVTIRTLATRIAAMVESDLTAAETALALRDGEWAVNAWLAYHRGLNHVFRFKPDEVARALPWFELSARLDGGFARARAAESFCHYYRAFTGGDPLHDPAAGEALRSAENAMAIDERDPAARWAYGRALWLHRDPAGARDHLLRAVALCPSFAHAHYMLEFLEANWGDPRRALDRGATAEMLSPLDPFLASIQVTRAIALARLGEWDEAADCALRAAAQPNVYPNLLCPAVLILAEAGRQEDAARLAAAVRRQDPGYSSALFFATLYTLPTDFSARLRRTADRIGL